MINRDGTFMKAIGLKPFMIKYKFKWLIVLLFLVVMAILLIFFTRINKSDNMEGTLTKKEIMLIAKKAFETELDLNVDEGGLKYDKENKVWDEFYAEYYPEISNRDYQAVKFTRPPPITIGGGPFWVLIDKRTGEIITFYIGM